MAVYDFSPSAFAEKAWDYFYQLSSIPRASGHEEAVRAWLIKLASDKGWEYELDPIKNIVLKIEGCGNLTDYSPLIIQGHMDMVCEKADHVSHDFMTEGLQLFSKEGWIYASETTLGADNGVALAYGLALADEVLPNKLPLELLFTVAEETGLVGAKGLDPSLLSGKTILNLDTEEENNIVIGCAGGEMIQVDFETTHSPKQSTWTCELAGLKGGHSGLDVETRYNALTQVAQLLKNLSGVKLHAIDAGTMTNAISRQCRFVISGVCEMQIREASLPILQQIQLTEPDASLTIVESESSLTLPDGALNFLTAFPNGVSLFHPAFTELIQTSSTLSVAKTEQNKISFFINTRSSSELDKISFNDKIEQLAEDNSAIRIRRYDNYPGWAPNSESKILKNCLDIFKKTTGKETKISSIHAGLECGILGEKIQSSEIISMGPTIEHPHSPEERLNIDSFERIYAFLIQFIQCPIT
jgi:dipeptidase D